MINPLQPSVALAATFLATAALAQDLTPGPAPQDEPIALVGASIHTISGDVISNGVLIFDKGVITAVAEATTVRLPSDLHTINIPGQHIYPGLIAAKTRLGLTEIAAVRAMQDDNEVGDFTPEVRAAVSINPDSTLIPVARSNGILTALTLPSGGIIPGQASIIRTDGWTWEDMAIQTNAALVINWPSTYHPADRWTGKTKNSRDDNIDSLDQLFNAAASYQNAPHPRPDLRLEAMARFLPSAKPGKPVLALANTVDQITSAVHFANTHNLSLIIMGGRDAPLCAQLLKDHAIPVILQSTHSFPSRPDAAFDEPFTLPARLENAGITWCLAPSDIDANVRNLPYQAATATAYGLDPDAAIRAITLAPAQILGLDNLGSIEPGKVATLIVTDGPLLEISTNVTRAYIEGRQVHLQNKQTSLRDKYRQKYQQLELIDRD